MSQDWARMGAVIVVVLFLGVALSGCIFNQFLPRWTASAQWHQPEIWDEFPEDGGVEGFRVEESSTGLSKSAVREEGLIRERIAVRISGDVSYQFINRPNKLSSDQLWENLENAFATLSLPEPSLNPEYQFSYNPGGTFAKWVQPEIWHQFPDQDSKGGYEIFTHDSLKVAQRIEATTSEWVRVNEEGDISYRLHTRGWFSEQKELHESQYGAEWDMSEVVWNRMMVAFEDLGLPEPGLDRSYEFTHGSWSRSHPV